MNLHATDAHVLRDARRGDGMSFPGSRRRATAWYPFGMRLKVETEREDDGRWIAEVPDLPGVMAYGATRSEALAAVEALAFRVLADRLEHGETAPEPLEIAFIAA